MLHPHARSSTSPFGDDQGQTSVEWIGIAAVVVGLIGALVLYAPGLGRTLSTEFQCLLNQAANNSAACGGAGAGLANGEPTRSCTTSRVVGSASLGVRVVVVDIGAGQSFIREEKSDGTVEVTFIDEGSVGASAQIGGGASVDVGNAGGGGEAEASAGGAITVNHGETRIFDNPEDADTYINDTIIDRALEAAGPAGLPARGGLWIIDQITGHETPQGQEGSTEGGVGIEIGADAEGAAGPFQLEGEVSASAGASVKTFPDGSREISLEVTQSGDGTIGLGPLAGELGIDGSARVTLKVDADGNATAIEVQGTVGGEAGIGVAGLDDLGIEGLEDSGILVGPDAEGEVVVTAELDLTDPAVRESAEAALGDLGDVLTGDRSPTDLLDTGSELAGTLEEHATITVETYGTGEFGVGAEASGNIGIGAGIDGEVSIARSELISAHYWDPDANRFVPWISCTG